ncbi:MAG: hypothetical protein R6U43_04320 [Candidatus Krumholzibacteriales bacterium]
MRVIFRANIFSKAITLIVLVCLFTSFSVSSSPKKTGEHISTNLRILRDISLKAFDEIMDNMFNIEKGSSVLLMKDRGVGDIDFVLDNIILKTLNDEGLRVRERLEKKEGETVNPDYILKYQIVNMTLSYPDIGRNWLIGEKEVERLAEISLFVQLVDGETGDTVWIGEAEKKFNDVIPHSLLDRVEDQQYAFTRPERDEWTWTSFIEPVVVTGIVTGLVYLFFSNQSNE